ncbi:MAG: LAGLIDADG family homing endonuclease [bacterium]
MNPPASLRHGVISESIKAEIDRATAGEIRAYLCGASRDGTFNQLHRTLRISQADVRWLRILQCLLRKLGKRSWMYREGNRNVWVIETTWRPESPEVVRSSGEAAAFVRGYFDAEGGVPAEGRARFYIQFVQKNHADLTHPRDLLTRIGVRCGRIHNPSVRRDPDYWRFYVLATSHRSFIQTVGSWHPRKRILLDQRALPLISVATGQKL